jgi:cysteine desulfurase
MSQPSSPAPGQYFDFNGSTPLHPRILALCSELQASEWGNSAAPHAAGRRAARLVEDARAELAAALGASPDETFFTSGGTESNNWALFGAAQGRSAGHLVVSAIEHKSVLNSALELQRRGFELTLLQPRADGAIHLRDLQAVLREDTFLASVMFANNETGVCQPVREIASLCHKRGVLFHCDAVAAMGKLPLDLGEIGCDLLSLSGHKFHAPKGVGALFIRRGLELPPLLHGCGHQRGLRSGTENTVGVVAMAAAATLAASGEFGRQSDLELRRQQLWNGIHELVPDSQRNGGGGMLPNTLNVHFPGLPAAQLQARLSEMGFSVAAGASSSKGTPSHVLLAMGLSPERASQSLRFSLGHTTTAADVALLLQHLPLALEAAREGSSAPLGARR